MAEEAHPKVLPGGQDEPPCHRQANSSQGAKRLRPGGLQGTVALCSREKLPVMRSVGTACSNSKPVTLYNLMPAVLIYNLMPAIVLTIHKQAVALYNYTPADTSYNSMQAATFYKSPQ